MASVDGKAICNAAAFAKDRAQMLVRLRKVRFQRQCLAIARLRLDILFIFAEYCSQSSVRIGPVRFERDRLTIARLGLRKPASALQRLREIEMRTRKSRRKPDRLLIIPNSFVGAALREENSGQVEMGLRIAWPQSERLPK